MNLYLQEKENHFPKCLHWQEPNGEQNVERSLWKLKHTQTNNAAQAQDRARCLSES